MVKHYVKICGIWVDRTHAMQLPPSKLGYTERVEGCRTWDTLRFAHTKGWPLTVTFTDAANVEHKVEITSSHDDYNCSFPVFRKIHWFGDEPDTTGLDAAATWAQVNFSFVDGTWLHSHGVRVMVDGYKSPNEHEFSVDTNRWKAIVDDTKTAADAFNTFMGPITDLAKAGAE